jgi:hypothetical protein
MRKACNIWSNDFEDAIQDCFLPAYDKAVSLKKKIFEACERDKTLKAGATVSFIIASFFFFLTYIFNNMNTIKEIYKSIKIYFQ